MSTIVVRRLWFELMYKGRRSVLSLQKMNPPPCPLPLRNVCQHRIPVPAAPLPALLRSQSARKSRSYFAGCSEAFSGYTRIGNSFALTIWEAYHLPNMGGVASTVELLLSACWQKWGSPVGNTDEELFFLSRKMDVAALAGNDLVGLFFFSACDAL